MAWIRLRVFRVSPGGNPRAAIITFGRIGTIARDVLVEPN